MKSLKVVIPALIAVCLMAGCLDPSRSQTQNWENVVVYINAVPSQDGTNDTVTATGATGASYGDILSMNQLLEHSGGSESDTRSYGNPQIPTGDSAISALVGAGAKGITEGLKNKPADGLNEEDSAKAVDPNCPDGNCSDAE